MKVDLFSRPIAHRGLFSVSLNQKSQGNKLEPGQELQMASTAGRGVENSMTAFQNARDLGFAIECDLRLSQDGVPCVFHDDSFERLTSAKGLFQEKKWDEIKNIQLLNTSDCIPSLRDLLGLVAGKVPLVLELKTFDQQGWCRSFLLEKAVLKELADYSLGREDRCEIGIKSFNPYSLEFLIDQGAPWPVGLLACNHRADGDFGFLGQKESAELENLSHQVARRADFISYCIDDLSIELVHRVNKPFMAWTIRRMAQCQKAINIAATPIFEETVAAKLLLI